MTFFSLNDDGTVASGAKAQKEFTKIVQPKVGDNVTYINTGEGKFTQSNCYWVSLIVPQI